MLIPKVLVAALVFFLVIYGIGRGLEVIQTLVKNSPFKNKDEGES